jgi:hypothetical protein
MKSGRTAVSILGVLLLLAGLVFSFQGAGYIGGSAMTGISFWLYAGAGIAVLGLLLLVGGLLMGSRGSQAPAPTTS